MAHHSSRKRTRKRSKRHTTSYATVRAWSVRVAAAALVVVAVYGLALAWSVGDEFEGRRWDLPAQVYAAPLELYAGRALSQQALVTELLRLGYREDPRLPGPGSYRVRVNRMEVATRGFSYADEREPARLIALEFQGGRIRALHDAAGAELPIVRLDPLLIGSLFPAHGEDRIIVGPDETPPLLTAALMAVEDRRFEQHHGIDLRAVARALWVNLSAGEIRQGASTLTQQLVRSYFLSNERTWWRKTREAFMALSLELRYSKDELLQAYVNEVYLGQDGARAIHGFGLGSQFYFGKPLSELDLGELALLVAEVRGPTYYDPYRHPARARARRDLVLQEMAAAHLVSADAASEAAARPLGVGTRPHGAQQSAFLDLVRRQLSRDYASEDLERRGLRVFSTFDPALQATAEQALAEQVAAHRDAVPGIDGAVIVTAPQTGEVRALVGGRASRLAGFNRALDARRQVGSLIKPAVYLAALESGRYTLASVVDDAPIEVRLENGDTWAPSNFDHEAHGTVPLVRALAESLNMATVRLGLDVGLESVAGALERLGLERRPERYPSMLLGALALTPLEVAQIYNTLANGGFRVPLRSVRSIVDADGTLLQRYPLELTADSDPAAVYALDQALVQVMERGTGRAVRRLLPPDLTVAGKTGTSDDLRDSWFAGFTSDHLVVAWLGADDNEPIGLTGATGAGRVWASVIGAIDSVPYAAPAPAAIVDTWIDYDDGMPVAMRCPNAVALPVPEAVRAPRALGCGGRGPGLGARLRNWFEDGRR